MIIKSHTWGRGNKTAVPEQESIIKQPKEEQPIIVAKPIISVPASSLSKPIGAVEKNVDVDDIVDE